MTLHDDLFNSKTIERLCNDVKLTTRQKQAAKEWLDMLELEQLKKEKRHYIDFAVIVLRDILGYSIKTTQGMAHEEGNVEFVFSNNENKQVICIEAKGSTQDLFSPQHRKNKEHETPIKQTWDYMGSIGLDYGICTNYKDFVLITKQFGYSKYYFFDFNSIKKNPERLKEFIGIFSRERIIEQGFVEKLHKKSIEEEREFTKEFYKLFHETRLMMRKAFLERGDVSEDEAIHYTQLYLNRLIFMFFAEDHGFLEDKLFTKRITEVLNSTLISEHSKLVSDEILGLFKAMDEGSHRLGIFGFNGGLFKEHIPPKIYFSDLKDAKFFTDERRNSKLKIKPNAELQKIISRYQNELSPIIVNLLNMDSFDFTTEVNVNILGHIFEQSISDLEELKEGETSRRKKEGIFYTPEYITDFICRNTIIPYLSKSGVNSIHELIKEYRDNIEELEKKFKEIKILDPACGSGAFLVKAIDILLEIHKEIQIIKESSGKYSTGNQFQLTKWNEETEARFFVEKNIFGVDINPESVEITKLSLFLKIASKNRKLIGLEENIKVGNSLIDDKNIDLRAFNWEKEFPNIFYDQNLKKNKTEFLLSSLEDGFDIIIGNPPYVRQELLKGIKACLKNNYQSFDSIADLYVYFVEKGIKLLKEKGRMSFIFPNKFMKTEYGKNLRTFLIDNVKIRLLYDFDDYPVFEDATTYPIILVVEKNHTINNNKMKYSKLENKKTLFPLLVLKETEHLISQSKLSANSWVFPKPEIAEILTKMEENSISLKDFVDDKIFRGISSGKNDVFIINQEKYDELIKDVKAKQILKKIVTGSEVKKYKIDFQNQYLLFITWEYDLEYSSTIKNYLIKHKSELEKRPEVKEGRFNWWVLSRYGSKNAKYLSEPKIIYPRITDQSNFCLDESGEIYLSDNNFFISSGSKSLLAVLNSSLIFFFLKQISSTLRGGFRDFRRPYIEKIPITKALMNNDEEFSLKADEILKANHEFTIKQNKYLSRVISKFAPTKINNKLELITEINFSDFLEEIKKFSSVKLTLQEQEEWEDYFGERQKELKLLQEKISMIEQQIDNMVFDLYDILPNERNIILQNVMK